MSTSDVVRARFDPVSVDPNTSRRSLEALAATTRRAVGSTAVNGLEVCAANDAEARMAIEAGLAVAEPAVGTDLLVLTLKPGCYPAPSMLVELVRALGDSPIGAVEAREIPFDASPRGCRLSRDGAASSTLVPSAVSFRDRRLTIDAAVVDPPLATGCQPASPWGEPFLSVIMRTQGRRSANLEEALTCLAAQTVDNFEVCLAVHHNSLEVAAQVRELVNGFADPFRRRVNVFSVEGGGRARPLNVALERAHGRYLAFLDDDDLVTADWVEAFGAGSEDAPGAVVRSVSVNQQVERRSPPDDAYVVVGEAERVFSARFDLLEHLRDNSTPIFSFAVPRTLIGESRFCEDLPALEDWDFLIRMALRGGVHDTGRVTGVYHWWLSGESSLHQLSGSRWDAARRTVIARLDSEPLLLPPGSTGRVVYLLEQLKSTQTDLAATRTQLQVAERELDRFRRSRWWRATGPLRWLTGRARRR